MITIMTTKAFMNAIDDAYAKGVSAGANAEAVKDREDQNRRLQDMFTKGKSLGYMECMDDHGIVDLDDNIDPNVFDEVEA